VNFGYSGGFASSSYSSSPYYSSYSSDSKKPEPLLLPPIPPLSTHITPSGMEDILTVQLLPHYTKVTAEEEKKVEKGEGGKSGVSKPSLKAKEKEKGKEEKEEKEQKEEKEEKVEKDEDNEKEPAAVPSSASASASASAPASAPAAPAPASSSSSSSAPVAPAAPASSTPAPSSVSTSPFVPTPPTVLYTPASRCFDSIRIKVRTFVDLQALKKKEAPSGDKGLKDAISQEIKMRKEKSERNANKESSRSESPHNALLAALQKERESEEAQRSLLSSLMSAEDKDKSKEKDEDGKMKGPPPQECIFECSPSDSLRQLIQRIIDFYAGWDIELEADSVRLVSNGVEISKLVENSVSAGVPNPAALAAAAASTPRSAGSSGSAGGSNASAASALLDSVSDERAPPLERLQRLANYCNQYGGLSSTLHLVQNLVQNTKKNGNKVDLRAMSDIVAQMASEARDNSSIHNAGAKGPTHAEKERFWRGHTMVAEVGLVPQRVPAVAEKAEATSSSSAAASSSSASLPSLSQSPLSSLPLFPLLMIYDELSRFTLDSTNLPSELSLTPDGLGCTMAQADNKWQTIKASTAFSSGRHSWKVRMDRCSGQLSRETGVEIDTPS
jgi:hypothetical protein